MSEDKRSPLLDGSPPFCRKCGCGGDWHYHGCIRGQQRGDTIWIRYGRLWDEAEAKLVRLA